MSARPQGGRNKRARRARAASLSSHFLYLIKFQLHRRRPPEDRDHHFQRLTVFIDVIHNPGKAGERTLGDPYGLALFELDLKLGLVLGLADSINDVLDFLLGKRRWLLPRTHKSGDPRRG